MPKITELLLEELDREAAGTRKALERVPEGRNDEHLMTTWRLVAQGHVLLELPRYVAIRDTAFNHMAHHRGQLTVYLRLNDIPVPSLYGPTADEKVFG